MFKIHVLFVFKKKQEHQPADKTCPYFSANVMALFKESHASVCGLQSKFMSSGYK